MLIDKSKFNSKKELITFMVKHKSELITQKKSSIKHADGFSFLSAPNLIYNKGHALKTNEPIENPEDNLSVSVVINSSNWFDSHEDVHIPGLWTKSLKENKNPMHVQEHKSNEFNKIIASGKDLKAYTESYTWKDLGYNLEGTTEALMHDSIIRKSRNPYMHDQYAKGYVTNHSVGMQYIKLFFCCDDEEFEQEFEMYKKYIDLVTNKDDITDGYFWAVTEAKYLEGSAVPFGSNVMTPTIDNNTEPQKALKTEPDLSTLIKDINNINFNSDGK